MLNIFSIRNNTPRWFILIIDLGIAFTSIISAYLLRFNFKLPEEYFILENIKSFYFVIPAVLIIRFLSFLISRTYQGLVRYTSTKDAGRIFFVLIIGSSIFGVINIITYETHDVFFIPVSVIGIDFLASVFLMTGSRFFVKALYLDYTISSKEKQNALVFGISELALITKRTLSQDIGSLYKVVAFVDSTNTHPGKKIDGLNVYDTNNLESLLEKYDIKALILAEKDIPSDLKTAVIDTCLQLNIKILSLPSVNDWINGELSVNQIKEIKIEDLLERSPIKLDKKEIRKYTLNKTILVTGAAGSIGSEIVKQLSKFQPGKIIVFDQAETPLYDLELDLVERYQFTDFEIVIGDLTNKHRLNSVFEEYKPSVVFHAAAYKHVPMMENHPCEAIRTNVFGTKMVADFAVEYGVHKFVMVSTDKAVNPTNVMGASKRIAEIYTQSLNEKGKTKFITTRFGNVLGSNGSVINRFRKQIQKGGPVTVTHPEITRYFMTIPEACQLVLEAGAMGNGGEIFIFDMGKSVKIVNLAKKMIQLSGLQIGKDIQISFTGLRPGEKLYEELLNNKENTLPTHHPQIMIGKVNKYQLARVENEISELIIAAHTQNAFDIVSKMKKLVPEFTSQNSIFEELDNEKEANKQNSQKENNVGIKNTNS